MNQEIAKIICGRVNFPTSEIFEGDKGEFIMWINTDEIVYID